MSELPEGISIGKRIDNPGKFTSRPTTATAIFYGGDRHGTTEVVDLPPPTFDGYEMARGRHTLGDPMPVQIGIVGGEADVIMVSGEILDYLSIEETDPEVWEDYT